MAGGLNSYQYTPNPINWVDPLGLMRCPCKPGSILNAEEYINDVASFTGLSHKEVLDYYSNLDDMGIDYGTLINNAVNKYNMSTSEAHAVFGYTTNLFYRDLNQTLGNGTPNNIALANLINSGIDKMPSAAGTNYRGIRLENGVTADSVYEQFAVGDTMETSFWSASNKEGDSYEGVQFVIETSSAKDISDLAFGVHFHSNPNINKPSYESETLIPAGTKVKVIDHLEDGSIKMREIK